MNSESCAQEEYWKLNLRNSKYILWKHCIINMLLLSKYHILYLAMFPLGTNKVFLTLNLTLILCHLIMFPQDRYTSFWRPEQNRKVSCNCEFNISLLIDYAANALHSKDSLWHDMAWVFSCYFSSVSIYPLQTVSIHLNNHSISSPSRWGRHNTDTGTSSAHSKGLYWHLWVQNSFP